MNWQNGQEFDACSGQVYGPPVGTMAGGYAQEQQQHQMQPQPQQHQTAWCPQVEVGTTEIPLLNDDHEKAILSDFCEQSAGESTPLSTFSYISEYICSNNIDIWPGEPAMVGSCAASTDHTGTTPADAKTSEQRSSAVCVHQQLFVRCRRVLESIIARNEQILELLRQRQQQQTTPRRRQ